MKAIIFIIALLGLSYANALAQIVQKVTFGTVLAVSGNTATNIGKIEPVKLGYNLSPNLFLCTKKIYCNFMYGLGNNASKMVFGWKPGTDSTEIGIYLTAVKNFSSKGGYVGLGAEKFVRAGDVTFFLFSEFGENINFQKNSQIMTVGIHANIQTLLWKRKT